jgi:hypothetical protein
MVTEKPLACNNLASEAEIIPLPREEVTPPVTKMYLTMLWICVVTGCKGKRNNGFAPKGYFIYS